MPTAGKGLLAMLGKQLTPVMQRTVRNAQVAGDLSQRFLTRLGKLHRFYLELSGKGSLGLWHDLFPFCEGLLFQVYLPYILGSRPPFCHQRSEFRDLVHRVFPFERWHPAASLLPSQLVKNHASKMDVVTNLMLVLTHVLYRR